MVRIDGSGQVNSGFGEEPKKEPKMAKVNPDCVWDVQERDGGWLYTGKNSRGQVETTIFTESNEFSLKDLDDYEAGHQYDISNYKYYSNGKVREITTDGVFTQGGAPNGIVDVTETFEYYPNGNVKKKVVQHSDGSPVAKVTLYDEQNRVIREEEYYEGVMFSKYELTEENGVTTEKRYTFDDEAGELKLSSTVTIQEKEYKDRTEITYKDSDGKTETAICYHEGHGDKDIHMVNDRVVKEFYYRRDVDGNFVGGIGVNLANPDIIKVREYDEEFNEKSTTEIVKDGNKRIATKTIEVPYTDYLENPSDGIVYPHSSMRDVVIPKDITYLDDSGSRTFKVELDPETNKPKKIIDYSKDAILGEEFKFPDYNIGETFTDFGES